MPNLFLSGLFAGFILILGKTAIKIILGGILALYALAGVLITLTFMRVYVKRLIRLS